MISKTIGFRGLAYFQTHPYGIVNVKMAIEIVDFPVKNGDFPWQYVSSPEGTHIDSYILDHWGLLPSDFSDGFRFLPHLSPQLVPRAPTSPKASSMGSMDDQWMVSNGPYKDHWIEIG